MTTTARLLRERVTGMCFIATAFAVSDTPRVENSLGQFILYRGRNMTSLSFENPVFCAYALAAGLMLLKAATHSWLTVFRMLKVKGGFRLPEDARKTPMNPNPSASQLEPNEYVERTRRLHQNEVENVPLFLASGLLYVLIAPRFAVAATLFAIYVVTRFIHFTIVMSHGTHDARATAWTPGSLVIYWMSGSVVVHAAQALL